jgi:hypothetical protein
MKWRKPKISTTIRPLTAWNIWPCARVKNLNPQDRYVMLDSSLFKSIGDKNVLYNAPAIVEPEPALQAYLYPGGESEGWVILQIAQGEGQAQIVFDPWFGPDQINRRYIALPR